MEDKPVGFAHAVWENGKTNAVPNAVGSAGDRRKVTRREWRRAAQAMEKRMVDAGIDPSPDVWQLLADKTLVDALGPMVGMVLTARRDEFANQMGRVQRARKKR